MVAQMPLETSPAFLVNSDLRGCPSLFASRFWESLSSLWEPGFVFWRRFVSLTMRRNSAVRSFIAIAILRAVMCWAGNDWKGVYTRGQPNTSCLLMAKVFRKMRRAMRWNEEN